MSKLMGDWQLNWHWSFIILAATYYHNILIKWQVFLRDIGNALERFLQLHNTIYIASAMNGFNVLFSIFIDAVIYTNSQTIRGNFRLAKTFSLCSQNESKALGLACFGYEDVCSIDPIEFFWYA